MTNKKSILDFLKKNELCVLATASKTGKPEAAVMVYLIKDDFSILVSTETWTRKYENIAKNSQVSIVVGGFKNDPTVQIDGLIEELAGEREDQAKKSIFSIHPEWKSYFQSPKSRFFKIRPLWLRYSDFSLQPPEIIQIEDFKA